LAAASGHLADAIKTVGVDNWPRFVADARRRAHVKATLAAIEKSRQPAISVSARVGGAGSGNADGGAKLAMAVEGKPAAGPVEELLQDLGLAHGGGAAPDAAEGAPAAGATEAPAPKPAAAEKPAPQTAGAKGEPPKPAINLGDTKTWPTPPGKHGPYAEGKPSRAKPASRGEKNLYDSMGGEWRLHLPDDYHEEMHWDYKPPWNNQQWQQFDLNGKAMK
jgi:hypothetical protein